MKKFYFFAMALFVTCAVSAQIIYSNNFENGVGTGASIVGSGQIETVSTGGFGHVFHNAVGGQALRSNYLLLPVDVMQNVQYSGTNELSIAFWVNKGTADAYLWTPIFSAYGAAPVAGLNTWPVMALESRLRAYVNCAGWTDLVNAENVNNVNFESTAWLDDAAWHYYTATFTETKVKVYVDGVIQNEWTLSGNSGGGSVSGLFTNGADLIYICLGGNQAFDWGDVDPAFMFDDLAVYSNALTVQQINANIAAKTTTAVNTIFDNSQIISEEFFTTNGAKAGNDFSKLKSGIYIKKALYSNGVNKSTKTIKFETK